MPTPMMTVKGSPSRKFPVYSGGIFTPVKLTTRIMIDTNSFHLFSFEDGKIATVLSNLCVTIIFDELMEILTLEKS